MTSSTQAARGKRLDALNAKAVQHPNKASGQPERLPSMTGFFVSSDAQQSAALCR
jgi:hypothetical protein